MQKLKQFLHWFFIKNHDFFGFKISMDFWMVFSLKMASKSRPFLMKKPYKKQDVFRVSQKSFLFAFLERSGTVPDDRIDFFFVFSIFGRKWSPKVSHLATWFFACLARGRPKTLQKSLPMRICDATLISHRFCMDFGTHFHWFLVVLGPILDCFLCWFAVFAVSQIPTH